MPVVVDAGVITVIDNCEAGVDNRGWRIIQYHNQMSHQSALHFNLGRSASLDTNVT